MSIPTIDSENTEDEEEEDLFIPAAAPTVALGAEHRKRLMKKLNIHDDVVPVKDAEKAYQLSQEAKDFDENEDLLNIYIPPKYEDLMCEMEDRRMIIKDIYVDNFKSYRGRHQIGPFHKNLTMILGPNGSGKSNVIDAILFVFGFRAQKIRTKKLSALIHSEEECKSTLVEIHFQQVQDITEEKYYVAPSKSFIIARSVQRDEKSQYFLNGEVVPQKRVQELLRSCGIDTSHNRFLILQGEVEAIAQMKPTSKSQYEEGMLEYIEDIVGTNRYMEPIKKLSHRVSMLEYKSSQYTAACRRHEGFRQQFLSAVEGACNYINGRNNLNQMRGLLNKFEYVQAEAVIASTLVTLKERRLELEEKKLDMVAAKHEKKSKYKELVAARNIVSECTTRRIDKEAEKSALETKIIERRAALKKSTEELKALFAKSDQVKAEYEALAEIPVRARVNKQNIRTELEELIKQRDLIMSEMTANLERAEEKSKPEKDIREAAEREFSDCNTALMNTTAAISILEDELSSMRVKDGEPQKRVDALLEQKENLIKFLERDRAELAKIQPQFEETRDKLNAARQQLLVREQNRDLQLTRFNQMEIELKEFAHADKKSNVYQHPSTSGLQQLADDGKFPGFIGRLGDLAQIPKRYDAAVSTIFGANLDYHIVENVEAAKLGVNLSTTHKLLRSTFFQLDYLTPETYFNINKTKHNFPAIRLADQVQCESEDIQRAYYFHLGNILVVDTLEQAQEIAKRFPGKFRYCTYEGSTLDRNGQMTGGGKPSTNRMKTCEGSAHNTVEKRNYIAKLKIQSENLKKELDNAATKIQEIESTIQKLNPKMRNLESRIGQLEPTIIDNAENLTALETELARLTQRIALAAVHECTEEDIIAKRKELADLKQVMVDQKEAMEAAKVIVARSTLKIEKMFIELVDKNKDKKDELAGRISGLEKAMAKATSQIENAPSQLAAKKNEMEELSELTALKMFETRRWECEEKTQAPLEDLPGVTKQLEDIWDDCRSSQLTLVGMEAEFDVLNEHFKRTCTAHRIAEFTENENHQTLESLEDSLVRMRRERRIIEQSWMKPEDLDDEAKYVHEGHPEMNELLEAGFIIMPRLILDKIVDFKTQYDNYDGTKKLKGGLSETHRTIHQLETNAESFRQKCDEKGIVQYCMLFSLQQNEINVSNASNAKLAAHRKKLNELRHARLSEFNEALVFLGTTTQMLYQMITNGGDASLKFVEEGKSTDPFEGGIKFSVRPAKKSWKLIENLSGGEKTLASLCFVFAMHHFRATPLYVMDEIDAALDLNNVRLIASYIKNSERTRNAQFIIISLRNQMFEVGNRLIGIYKVNGCTHNVVINPDSVENGFKKNIKRLEVGISGARKAKQDEEIDIERRMRESLERVHIEKTPTPTPTPPLPPRPRRKRPLGNLKLSDFGLDSEEEDNAESCCPRLARLTASVERDVPVYTYLELVDQERSERAERAARRSCTRQMSTVSSIGGRDSYQEFDEEGDEPIIIRKKKKVEVEDDEDEDEDDEELFDDGVGKVVEEEKRKKVEESDEEDEEEEEEMEEEESDDGAEELAVGRTLPSRR